MNILKYISSIKRNNNEMNVLPSMLTYIVTFKCNARCIMCDCWKKKQHDDLTLDEIEKMFLQLPQMDFLRLTGGEPFVREDFSEIYDLSKEYLKPEMTHVTTNGFLTERIVEFCEKRDKHKPLYLLLSMDGMKDKHNYVRGTEKAWDLINATLSELAPNMKKLNLRISINQTIVDQDGLEQFELLSEYLKKYKIHLNAVVAYDVSSTYSQECHKVETSQIGTFTTFGNLKKENIIQLVDKAEKKLDTRPLSEKLSKKYYYDGIRNRLIEGIQSPAPKCVALASHMRIFPDGSVPVCQFNSSIVGNFRKDSFAKIWNNSETEKYRNWVRNCPGCWAECEVLPNAFYTGDIFKHYFRRKHA